MVKGLDKVNVDREKLKGKLTEGKNVILALHGDEVAEVKYEVSEALLELGRGVVDFGVIRKEVEKEEKEKGYLTDIIRDDEIKRSILEIVESLEGVVFILGEGDLKYLPDLHMREVQVVLLVQDYNLEML